MDEKTFQKLIKKYKFQVFLFKSSVAPFGLGVHTWFVINLKGKIHRFEFGRFFNKEKTAEVRVYKNLYPPTQNVVGQYNSFKFKSESKLIHYIEGDKHSLAEKLAIFIKENSKNYPLRNQYKLLGPNSNTFIMWILSNFPKNAGFKLPLTAIGKNHKL